MGYYVGIAKFHPTAKRRYLWTGILMATLLHGFYDFFLFQNITAGLYAGAILSLIVGIYYSLKAMRLHKENSPFQPDQVAKWNKKRLGE